MAKKDLTVTVKVKDLRAYMGGINSYFGSMPFCVEDVLSNDCQKAEKRLEKAIEEAESA